MNIKKINFTKTFESHLNILNHISKVFKPKTVLEFGCGDASTGFFISDDNIESLTSLEMNNVSWHEKIKNKFESDARYLNVLSLGKYNAIAVMQEIDNQFDLIFVDGHGDSRPEVINEAVNFTNLIVVHDTQEKSYRWHLVNKELEGWEWIDLTTEYPWTSIFTNDAAIINYFKNSYKD